MSVDDEEPSEAALISAMIGEGRFDEAEARLRDRLADDPKEPGFLALLGVVLGAQKREVEGLEAATLATEEAPRFPFAHYARANLLRHLQRPEDALHAAQRAVELDPDDADYHVLSAEILAEMGLWERAHAAVRRALVIDDTHAEAVNLRLHLELRHGPVVGAQGTDGTEEMLDALGSAREREPDNAETEALMGQVRLEQGEYATARTHLRRALDLDPDLPLARHLMVETLKRRFAPYRWLTAFENWSRDAGGLVTILVLVGAFLVYNSLFEIAEDHPEHRIWAIPLIAVYLGFVLLSWIGDAVFEAAVWLHPDGRRALPPTSRHRALALVSLLVLAAFAVGSALFAGYEIGFYVGLMLTMNTLPVTQAFVTGHERELRPKFIALAFMALTLGFIGCASMGLTTLAGLFAQIHLWGFVAYLWLGNLLGAIAMRRG